MESPDFLIFTNADQIDYSTSGVNTLGVSNQPPWIAHGSNGTLCAGAGKTELQSGLYSYLESDPGGSLKQLYPPPSVTGSALVTPVGKLPKWYSEFPVAFAGPGGQTYMIFLGSSNTPPNVIDACPLYTGVGGGCQFNFTGEAMEMNVTTGQFWPLTNWFTPGSSLSQLMIDTTAMPPTGTYGGCSRIAVNMSDRQWICFLGTIGAPLSQGGTTTNDLLQWQINYTGSPLNVSALIGGNTKHGGSMVVR